MVVEVFVAQGDERAQAVLDPVGVAVIGEAVRHLVKERQAPLDPSQQQGAGIGSDGPWEIRRIFQGRAATDFSTTCVSLQTKLLRTNKSQRTVGTNPVVMDLPWIYQASMLHRASIS